MYQDLSEAISLWQEQGDLIVLLIDSIFISKVLSITAGGYFPFGVSPSDYRVLWIKLRVDAAFRYNFN